MVFEKEEDMYELIQEYFQIRGYKVIIDKPHGSGVKFKSLKGWIIDVVGVKKQKSPEVVAIEAKNSLGSSAVLDAYSKAEMYRNVCNRVFVAFPKMALHLRENKETAKEIRHECQRRGIGMLEVGAECKEVLSAIPSSLRIGMLRDLLNEFERNTVQFDGFEEEDFVRYFSENEQDVVKHKLRLLVKEVETRLKAKGLVLTHDGPDWFSFSKKLPAGERYWRVPHFTVNYWSWEAGIMAEFIAREGRSLNNLRRKIQQNPDVFDNIIGTLKNKMHCEIKIDERIHVGGYTTHSSSEYIVSSNYLDRIYASKLRTLILQKGRKGKIWLWIGHLFHLSEEETHSAELINSIEEFVNGLMELYNYLTN
jgi:hypothetical protein